MIRCWARVCGCHVFANAPTSELLVTKQNNVFEMSCFQKVTKRPHRLNASEAGSSNQQHSMLMTLLTGPMHTYRVFSS